MKKEAKGVYKYGLLFLLFILITPVTFAQGFFDFLYVTDLSSLYDSGFEWWDFFIYFAIFGALGRIIFEKRFQGHKSADLLAVAVAVALSLSLVYYETSVLGQSLIMIGGYPILIFAAFLAGLGLFIWTKNKFGIIGGLVAAILIFLLLPYILRSVPGAELPSFIENPLTDFGPVVIVLLLIAMVLSLAGKIRSGPSSTGDLGGTPSGSLGGPPVKVPGGRGWNPFKRKPGGPKPRVQTPVQQVQQVNQQQIMQAIANMKDHLEHIADRSAQLNILLGRVINDTRKSPANDPIKATISLAYNYRINTKSYDNIKRILSIIQSPGTKDSDRKSALVLLENSLTDILNSVQGIMKVLKDINNPVDGYLRSKNVNVRIYLIAKYIGQLCSRLIPYSNQIRKSIP